MEMTPPRILVVDDEAALCDALRLNLELEGYEVDTAYSAEEALAKDLGRYSLLLLDIMMGEISGLQLARIVKGSPALSATPIIFLTARDGEDDMVGGLDIGADDYIAKPYSVRNVLARVKSVLRRAGQGHPMAADPSSGGNGSPVATGHQSAEPDAANGDTSTGHLAFGGLIADRERKLCKVDGEEVRLPRKEFEILCLLLANPGRIFSREEFLQRIWPEDVIVVERVVDVNITRLRSKIGRYGKLIVTRSGYGYGWQA